MEMEEEVRQGVEKVVSWMLREIVSREEWSPLKFRASQLGALVGVNAYAELDEVWTDLIYQGRRGELLLAEDAKSIGVIIATKDELAMSILEGTSKVTKAEVKACLEAAESTSNTTAVEAVLMRTREALDEAVRRKELSSRQAADLCAHAAQRTRTDFGTRAEAAALKEYRERTGNDITDCNERLLVWNFPSDPSQPPSPVLDHDARCKKYYFDKAEEEHSTLFRIVGKVDGIAHEVDFSHPDPECWSTQRVVVEIKNRLNRLSQPQLYDQLQLVAYMQMTQCSQGDLVQRLATGNSNVDTLTTRLQLSAHDDDWHKIVVPRLYEIANTINDLRRNESRRRAWLAYTPRERWLVAAELASFLPFPPAHYRGAFFHDSDLTISSNKTQAELNTWKHIHLKQIDRSILDVLPKEIADEIRQEVQAHTNLEEDVRSPIASKETNTAFLAPATASIRKINSYFSPRSPSSGSTLIDHSTTAKSHGDMIGSTHESKNSDKKSKRLHSATSPSPASSPTNRKRRVHRRGSRTTVPSRQTTSILPFLS